MSIGEILWMIAVVIAVAWGIINGGRTGNRTNKTSDMRSKEELIADLMHKSAELSEAGEEIERLRLAIKTHRDQKDHNKCWMNDFRLHQQLQDGKNSPLPNPQKVTLAEMLWGCLIYCPEQYQTLSEEERRMTGEIKEVAKKYLY